MSNLRFTLNLAFQCLATLLLLASSMPSLAQTFVWEMKRHQYEDGIPRVIFTNGAIIERIKNTSFTFGSKVTATTLENKIKSVLIENDYASIVAAYPNNRRASAVLLYDDCVGSLCAPTLTVVTTDGKFLKSYALKNAPSKVTLTVNNGVLISGRAEGMYDGLDEYGSEKTIGMSYLGSTGFVVDGFKREYSKLIGQHPDTLFADEVLRRPLAKAAGLEIFRDLRQAIQVASPIVLVKGRYLVLQGCMPHFCSENYSFILIDALTSDFYWTRYNSPSEIYAGGTKKTDKTTMESVLASDAFFHYEDVKLIVNSEGFVTFAPKSP